MGFLLLDYGENHSWVDNNSTNIWALKLNQIIEEQNIPGSVDC